MPTARVLEIISRTVEDYEASANVAYELTFLLAAVVCFVYVVLIKRDRLVPKMEAPKYLGAVCETAGQFAYIYAIADTEHLAMSAPIIASYCAASVLWSRIFLKEKLSWKHYAMIALIVAGPLPSWACSICNEKVPPVPEHRGDFFPCFRPCRSPGSAGPAGP